MDLLPQLRDLRARGSLESPVAIGPYLFCRSRSGRYYVVRQQPGADGVLCQDILWWDGTWHPSASDGANPADPTPGYFRDLAHAVGVITTIILDAKGD